ncbi:hypothetical protein ACLBWP_11255 [Microbacterium sp. M1A1_1b]
MQIADILPDHAPDAAAPRPRTSPDERSRFAVLTIGTLVTAAGVVLAVAALLPFLAGWFLPVVLTALTGVFLALGRRAAGAAASPAARAWAAWAGVAGSLAVGGLVNLAGLGGALVAVVLVVIALNAAIALWFRSPVHFAVVQVLAVAWGALAHVYGILPVATLVVAVAGPWWTRVVGTSRTVVVTTTVSLPIAVALLVHPLTHTGPGVDGADVAVLTGAVAVAMTWTGVIGRARPVSTLWSTARATAITVLAAQVVAGAVPAVATLLDPVDPWAAVLLAVTAVLASGAVVAVRPVRAGTVTVLVLAAVQLAELVAAIWSGTGAATTTGLAGLLVVVVVALVRSGSARRRAVLTVAALLLPVVWASLVALPVPWAAGVLVVIGLVVVVAQMRPAR